MNRRTVVVGSIVASAVGLSALVLVAPPASASSSPAARYGVINATVNAATDHEVGASSAFPNYTTGAVDNYYSLAHTHIDNSPFAEGTASPADTGPVGQTGASQASVQQPQYADARWPGAKDGQSATVGSSGGPSGSATATAYKATALSSEASASSTPGGTLKIATPPGFNHRLYVALAAWRARWLLPLGLLGRKPNFAALPIPTVTVPTVPGVTIPTLPSTNTTTTSSTTTTTSTTPSSAPENGGFVASSLAEVDPKSRAVFTSGESSMGTVSIAAGQIVLKDVHVKVTITNTGKPNATITDSVGGATVGGVPVTIDQNGVHVDKQGSGLPYAAADAAMNAALKSAGAQIYTVAPQVKKSANELEVTATGTHVVFNQPVSPSGVPSQSVEHIIGEVFIDSLAAPGTPLPKLSLGGGSGLPSVGGGNTTGGSGGTSVGSGSSSGSGSTSGSPSSFLTAVLNRPLWLLIAYLVWQSIVIATGATLWRWRAAGGMT